MDRSQRTQAIRLASAWIALQFAILLSVRFCVWQLAVIGIPCGAVLGAAIVAAIAVRNDRMPLLGWIALLVAAVVSLCVGAMLILVGMVWAGGDCYQF